MKKKEVMIEELPIDKIDQFPKHPFKVLDDEDMLRLVESIRDNGVIVPIVVRTKSDGRYELISGHRRLRACKYLGHKKIRGEVVDMDRNTATVMMVDSNLSRSRILPSEKAFAYKMRMDAMKRSAGRPSDRNYVPMGLNNTRSQLAKELNESQTQIQRYIRLTNLIPMLRELVDEGRIALRPAVEISYLTEELQDALADCIFKEDCTPSHYQAIRMRQLFKEGKLSAKDIDDIMCELKPNQTSRISLPEERIRQYIPRGLSANKQEDFIVQALRHYDRYLKRQKENER